MRKQEGRLIKTQAKNGLVIYRNAGSKEASEEEIQEKITRGDDTLEWRFALITSKLKTFVSILGDNCDDVGLLLTSIIKETESELEEISETIEKTLGDIVFFYDDAGEAWPGYTDQHIVGVAFRPAKGRLKEVV